MKCFVNVSLICRRHSARELLRQYVRKCTVNIYTMVTVLPPAISSPKGNQPLMRSSLNLPFCRIWNGKAPVRLFRPRQLKCLWSCAMSLLWETKGGGGSFDLLPDLRLAGKLPLSTALPAGFDKKKAFIGRGGWCTCGLCREGQLLSNERQRWPDDGRCIFFTQQALSIQGGLKRGPSCWKV